MLRKFILATAFAAAATASFADGHGKKTIVDIAVADERFSTLVAAVTAAGLAETLAGPGPFTVYAPVNDAFAALPDGTVETLLKPETRVSSQMCCSITWMIASSWPQASRMARPTSSRCSQVSAFALRAPPTV
jgi:hypothetical protein